MSNFQPDWDLLKATQETLQEHMQRIRELQAENQIAWDKCDIAESGLRAAEATLGRVSCLLAEWSQQSPLHYDLQRCIDQLEEALAEPITCSQFGPMLKAGDNKEPEHE